MCGVSDVRETAAGLKANSAKMKILYMGARYYTWKKKKRQLYYGLAGFVFLLCFLGTLFHCIYQAPSRLYQDTHDRVGQRRPSPQDPRKVSIFSTSVDTESLVDTEALGNGGGAISWEAALGPSMNTC